MSKTWVYEWQNMFLRGCTNFANEEWSGRPSDSTSAFENIQQIRDLLKEDRRMSITELCTLLRSPDCACTSVWRIIHHILGFCKLTSRWVPHLLTADHQKNQMGAALQFLTAFNREGPSLLGKIITGDETWVHHNTLESKEASICSRHWNYLLKHLYINESLLLKQTMVWTRKECTDKSKSHEFRQKSCGDRFLGCPGRSPDPLCRPEDNSQCRIILCRSEEPEKCDSSRTTSPEPWVHMVSARQRTTTYRGTNSGSVVKIWLVCFPSPTIFTRSCPQWVLAISPIKESPGWPSIRDRRAS